MKPSLTIINDKGVQGVLLLSLSKQEIEDVVDFVELSGPASQRETKARLKEKRVSLAEMEELSEAA